MANKRKARNERVAFGVPRTKLSLSPETEKMMKEKKLFPRWFNDDDHGSRLKAAEDGGYEFVTADGTEKIGEDNEAQVKGKAIKKLVGTHKDGSPQFAYLMAINEKWHKEDMIAKERTNQMVDEAIRSGSSGGKSHGVDPSLGSTNIKNVSYKP